MNILICNVGSTSLKYQLFRMPEELVVASGGAERVGMPAGRFYAKTHENGALVDEAAAFPTHREAIERMLRQLQETVLPALSQLDCVKNERFVTIALESVLPGSRMAYAVERFAAGFYPEIFADE